MIRICEFYVVKQLNVWFFFNCNTNNETLFCHCFVVLEIKNLIVFGLIVAE